MTLSKQHNFEWLYHDPIFEYNAIFDDSHWPWAGHKRFIYDYVRSIRPSMIVELGTHKGTSLFSICQAIKDGRIQASINAIDTWIGDEQAGYYDESVYKEVCEIRKRYYSRLDVNLIRSTFDQARDMFADSSIDLLHIDGLHIYEAVKHDFNNYFSKVNKEGIILLHDTANLKDNGEANEYGSVIFLNEIKDKFPYFEFIHSWGLGLIFPTKNFVYRHLLKQNFICLRQRYEVDHYRNLIKLNPTAKWQKEQTDKWWLSYIEANNALEAKQQIIDAQNRELLDLKAQVFMIQKDIINWKSLYWGLNSKLMRSTLKRKIINFIAKNAAFGISNNKN